MAEPLRETCLTIGFDGDRVVGSLCDERGSIRTFSGWLDLIAVLKARPGDRPRGLAVADRRPGMNPPPSRTLSPYLLKERHLT